MKIEVGQDATGKWAWMIRDARGELIDSDDGYWEAQLALEGALRRERRIRRQGGR